MNNGYKAEKEKDQGGRRGDGVEECEKGRDKGGTYGYVRGCL